MCDRWHQFVSGWSASRFWSRRCAQCMTDWNIRPSWQSCLKILDWSFSSLLIAIDLTIQGVCIYSWASFHVTSIERQLWAHFHKFSQWAVWVVWRAWHKCSYSQQPLAVWLLLYMLILRILSRTPELPQKYARCLRFLKPRLVLQFFRFANHQASGNARIACCKVSPGAAPFQRKLWLQGLAELSFSICTSERQRFCGIYKFLEVCWPSMLTHCLWVQLVLFQDGWR